MRNEHKKQPFTESLKIQVLTLVEQSVLTSEYKNIEVNLLTHIIQIILKWFQ